MKKTVRGKGPLIFAVLIGIAAAACSPEFKKVPFEKACDRENQNQKITVEGYIGADSIVCDSSDGGNCNFWLSEISGEKGAGSINFSLKQGTKGNQVERSESGGSNSGGTISGENIKIRSADGQIVNLREKVAVSGTTEVIISSGMMPLCRMDLVGIEQ
ncbi:MAG: hypothetical protein R2747_14660 [Pyrinomonadaceae bacterium]